MAVSVPVRRTFALPREAALRLSGRPLTAAVLAVLIALALVRRDQALDAPFWIDEALSVGIAGHPLHAIPGLLRLDGSPPLYYVLLHVWIDWFGRGEMAVHALSVVFAVASVPAAWWATTAVFGRRAAALAGALVAVSPFVGEYADEGRMYALLLLVALLTTGAFLRAYVARRRRWAPVFGIALAFALYTHNWAAFFALAAGVAYLVLLLMARGGRRALLLEGIIGFGTAVILFAPWVPTALFQAAHTGAPWSVSPSLHSLSRAFTRMGSGQVGEIVLLVVAGAGLANLLRRAPAAQRRGAAAVLVVALGTLLIAWGWSRLREPAWAMRYLVIVLAPLVVVIAAALSRAGTAGVVAVLALFVFSWHGHPSRSTLEHKSNVKALAHRLAPRLPPGTIVVSPQPEQVAALHYYLPPGMRFVTPLGVVRDPGVTDWRDALARLRAARYARVIAPVVAAMRPGQRLLLVQPKFGSPAARWTRRIRALQRPWRRMLQRRLHVLSTVHPTRGSSRSTVLGVLMVKTRSTARGA